MKTIDFEDENILDVDLDESPKKRWDSVVEQTGDQICEVVGETVAFCEKYFDELPTIVRPLALLAVHGAAGLSGRAVGLIAKIFGQEYQTEIQALAKKSGVSYPQLLLGNLMYDISQIGENRMQPSACSSYSCNLPDGTPVLARNMDWAIPDSLGRHTLLVRFHRGRRNYLSVSVAGKVGVLSAMRPGHWAVTLNQAPAERIKPRWFQTPALQRLRQACDQFGGYRDLVRRVREYQTMSPFFAHLVGIRPGHHMVISGLGDEFASRSIDGPSLIQTNHFVCKELKSLNGPDEWKDKKTGQTWVHDSKPRYQAIKRRLKELPKTLDVAIDKLKRRPVTNENTMQQMVFCPANRDMRLRVKG